MNKSIVVSAILSTATHLFCCVLPAAVSVLSLLTSVGFLASTPIVFDELHHVLHDWEVPILIFAGVMLVFGWAVHFYSLKVDCHETGCHHEPCEPQKRVNFGILLVASVLFVLNIIGLVIFH